MRGASDDDVEERGVELGLSLGSNKNHNRNTAPSRWGPAWRILTAKDFPASIAGRSRSSRASPSPTPSRSSSVSSSSVRAVDADSGTDVVVGSTSPETGSGSANPSGSVPYIRNFVSCCLFFIFFPWCYLFATIYICKEIEVFHMFHYFVIILFYQPVHLIYIVDDFILIDKLMYLLQPLLLLDELFMICR
jgi:hypothetical protein